MLNLNKAHCILHSFKHLYSASINNVQLLTTHLVLFYPNQHKACEELINMHALLRA